MQHLKKPTAAGEPLPTVGQSSIRAGRGCEGSSSVPCWAEDDVWGLQEGWKLGIVNNRIIPEGEGTDPSYKTLRIYVYVYIKQTWMKLQNPCPNKTNQTITD